jgi:RNA polymerase sigma-70 factor (ECF subfamily)
VAINAAKTRATRDGRMVSFSDAESEGGEPAEPAVDPSRFYSWGLFNAWPDRWGESPEGLSQRREVREAIEAGLASLPDAQRAVVTLRDLEGWTSEEVCNALEVSESNQRVLLHRGRSRLRAVLERVMREEKNP